MIKKSTTLALIVPVCVVLSFTCTKPLEGSGNEQENADQIGAAEVQWPEQLDMAQPSTFSKAEESVQRPEAPIVPTPEKTKAPLNTLEPRAAAFFPSWGKFRKIYGDVGLSLQLEAARTLKNHHWLEIWENLEWIFMDGTTGRCHTDIDIVDLSVGLKFVKRAFREKLFLYLGAGIDAGGVFIENDLRCGHSETSIITNSGGDSAASPNPAARSILALMLTFLYLPITFICPFISTTIITWAASK
jgi:hypothetical protein